MNIKKIACAFFAGVMLLGTTAMAKDNIYAYNKFVSTTLGPQTGYCDFGASFAGKEVDFANVNDYFTGLISAFYDDIDGDLNNELITVESDLITVYRAGETSVITLGSIDKELIANFGDSYSNVFLVNEGRKKYIGVETYGTVVNSYSMNLYDLNPDTDEFKNILSIEKESNEDGIVETVWAKDKTYYSYSNGGGILAVMNPDNYADCASAAGAALKDTVPQMTLSQAMKDRMEGASYSGDQFRLNEVASNVDLKTYIRATGVRFVDRPVVWFEDYSNLNELKVKPEIVTVTVDGNAVQFLDQDPVIVDNRTLVPERGVFEALGAMVEWKGETKQISVTTEDTTVVLTLNSQEYNVNGDLRQLDVPAQLMNDRTMIPLRAIGEALGCQVEWVDETKTAVITSNNQ